MCMMGAIWQFLFNIVFFVFFLLLFGVFRAVGLCITMCRRVHFYTVAKSFGRLETGDASM